MAEAKENEMNQADETEHWIFLSPNSTIPGIEAAMRRATMKARRRAIALTGRVVTIRNGKVEYDTEP